MSFSRRALLKASAASAVLGGIGAPLVARAQAAEFTYKYANNLPDGHPMNARAREMAAATLRPAARAVTVISLRGMVGSLLCASPLLHRNPMAGSRPGRRGLSAPSRRCRARWSG